MNFPSSQILSYAQMLSDFGYENGNACASFWA